MKRAVLALFGCILVLTLSVTEISASVFSDPGIFDGEQIVWCVTKKGSRRKPSIITWNEGQLDGKPVYEIIEDSGDRKRAKYIVNKSSLCLIKAEIFRSTNRGPFNADIKVKKKRQYLVYSEGDNKTKDRKIDHHWNGYNGVILPHCLRGFPFGEQKEVEFRVTPPIRPGIPGWAWKQWKTKAKYMGTEQVTVPAGTFDCHKLEVEASGGLIKRITSKYYFWYRKESPHQFVRYQDEDGDDVTELIKMNYLDTE